MIETQFYEPTVLLNGELTSEDLPTIKEIRTNTYRWPRITIDFSEADVADGRAMAALTKLIKGLLDEGRDLDLVQPPQLVVHNLYRVGYHPHASLRVHDMRMDEASA